MSPELSRAHENKQQKVNVQENFVPLLQFLPPRKNVPPHNSGRHSSRSDWLVGVQESGLGEDMTAHQHSRNSTLTIKLEL